MILDGAGEEISCSFYHFKNNNFKLIYKSRASLGYFYVVCHRMLWFFLSSWRRMEKVMGLSAYGKYDQEIYQFFKDKNESKGN